MHLKTRAQETQHPAERTWAATLRWALLVPAPAQVCPSLLPLYMRAYIRRVIESPPYREHLIHATPPHIEDASLPPLPLRV